MRHPLAFGGLALAVLVGGSFALVFISTRAPSRSPSPEPDALAAPPLATTRAPSAAPSEATPPAGPGPVRMRAASWSVSDGDRSSPPMANRVVRKLVRRALLAPPLQSQLARCVDLDAGFGGPAVPGPIPPAKPPVLLLELEALGDQVRIADAKVREWSEASEASVSCARHVLLGHIIAVTSASPGERYRMPFPLNPRTAALGSPR